MSATTTKSNTPTETDLRGGGALHALHGIFWALDMFLTHKVADEIANKDDRDNAIDELISAGEITTDGLSARF